MRKRPHFTSRIAFLLALAIFSLHIFLFNTGTDGRLALRADQPSPLSPEQKQQILVDTVVQDLGSIESNITDKQVIGNWARVGLLDKQDSSIPLIDTDGMIIIGFWAEDEWILYTEGTEMFRSVLPQVPDSLIPATQKHLLDYVNPSPDADPASVTASGFRLPWKAGDTRTITRAWSTGSCNHDGSHAVDVSMQLGTDILAMKGGKVTHVVDNLTSCGCSSANAANYVQIDHGDGTAAQYIHIGKDQALVSVNQSVIQGQVIARSHQIGYTCGSGTCAAGTCSVACTPGPHLHFAVIRNGVRQYISFDDVGEIVGCQSYTSGNSENQCCGCSSGLAMADAKPLGGNPVGPPAPQPEPAVAFDLTLPGDLSTDPSLLGDAGIADVLPPHLDTMPVEDNWSRATTPSVLTWPAAVDDGSGVAGYRVYWGPDANGTAETLVAESSFVPTLPDISSGAAVHYLRVAPLDNAGNLGEWQTVNVWRYDAVSPDGTIEIRGGEVVPILPVTLNLTAVDEHSGVADMRFSAEGMDWGEWEPYAAQRNWQLADVDSPQVIYVQFRDKAGNVSVPATTTVTADLTLAPPSSANYSITRSVMGMGGGVKSSANYQLSGTSGQPYQTGVLQSSGYRLSSGYWAQTSALSNNPPNAPGNPNPTTDATTVPVTTALSWSATDPDNDPLTYEVRFGTANPPPQVVADQSATTYDPPGDLAHNTTYYWQVVANDSHGGGTAGPVWSFTTMDVVEPPPDIVYLSPSSKVTLNGVDYQDEDILAYDETTNSWSLFFDGSAVGLTKADVSAFELLDDGSILLSLDKSMKNLPGLPNVTADDSDILRFTPTGTGTNTAGTFAIWFDGSDVELTKGGEKIDAIAFTPGGDLIISTSGAASVTGPSGTLKVNDEDLLIFHDTSLGSDVTAGTWDLYFDAGDVSTKLGDIVAAGIDTNGDILFAVDKKWVYGALTVNTYDVARCVGPTTGANSACASVDFSWQGAQHGFNNKKHKIDGFALGGG